MSTATRTASLEDRREPIPSPSRDEVIDALDSAHFAALNLTGARLTDAQYSLVIDIGNTLNSLEQKVQGMDLTPSGARFYQRCALAYRNVLDRIRAELEGATA